MGTYLVERVRQAGARHVFGVPGDYDAQVDVFRQVTESAVGLVARAQRPVILGGVEVRRFRLRRKLEALIDRTGYPVATALMGKSPTGSR